MSTRVHTSLRWLTVPLPAVDALVPARGRILDFGCGHGLLSLLLALNAPGRTITAVDVDEEKLAHGAAAARRLGVGDRIAFEHVAPDWRPVRAAYDAVVVVDVLYLLGHDVALRALELLAEAVAPGGRLVVKEMADAPRWKHALAGVQEQAAVRVLSLTAGTTVDLVAEADLVRTMTLNGLQVHRRDLHHGYLHPHLLVAGDRPNTPTSPTGAPFGAG